MNSQVYLNIQKEWDIVGARQAGRDIAKEIGFGTVDQARITTAISEMARNIYLYADKGQIYLKIANDSDKKGLTIISADTGPGIRDVSQAMQDGYSTSGGLGAGLPGIKRLMDEFDVQSEEGKGTTITTFKWLR